MSNLVLIVEDYEDTREFMRFLLEGYGYDVIEASDGIEAMDRVRRFHPDLILMDISLPLVDGLTATRAIREFESGEFEHGKPTPIIALTAFGKTFKSNAIDAGCNELLEKPVDFERLEPLIRSYLVH